MIICLNCQHKNLDGAIFCAECGAQLAAAEITTQSIRTDRVMESVNQHVRKIDFPQAISDTAWGSLHLMDSGQILLLVEREEFTLGRISEGQPIMPDLDLSPYQAYASGVSRLHALLKRDGKRVILMDLGSANGTYVNGKRLTANVERLLSHGDVVALGKFKFQVLIK